MGTSAPELMTEHRSVSDLVFRDLAPDPAVPPTEHDEAWEALLREELGKLRARREGPRVVPASEAVRSRDAATDE
jgi:hypothetical protein